MSPHWIKLLVLFFITNLPLLSGFLRTSGWTLWDTSRDLPGLGQLNLDYSNFWGAGSSLAELRGHRVLRGPREVIKASLQGEWWSHNFLLFSPHSKPQNVLFVLPQMPCNDVFIATGPSSIANQSMRASTTALKDRPFLFTRLPQVFCCGYGKLTNTTAKDTV